MRLLPGILTACAVGILYATPLHADHQPQLAVPGNPTMPVVINGYVASWSVVEGDWGLHRAGQAMPVLFYPYDPTVDRWGRRTYFPFTGKRPRMGRLEVIPPENRRLPPPAESYFRYWSTDGTSVPAQTEPSVVMPPPAVIVAPRVGGKN